MIGYLNKGLLSVIMLGLIMGCGRVREDKTPRTAVVKALIQTEQFSFRIDSLFPNGLMKNVEIYDQSGPRSEVGFHHADSAKWVEGDSDTLSGELEVFRGLIFGAETTSTNFLHYEQAKYFFRHPIGITLFRDRKVAAVMVTNGIGCRNGEIVLKKGWSINNPIEETHLVQFETYNLTKAIKGEKP